MVLAAQGLMTLCECAVVNGASWFAIHAADGTPMAIAGGLDVAVATIEQYEMMPAPVH
jgi:hypothetical protein